MPVSFLLAVGVVFVVALFGLVFFLSSRPDLSSDSRT